MEGSLYIIVHIFVVNSFNKRDSMHEKSYIYRI
jgi:hypothetical protein